MRYWAAARAAAGCDSDAVAPGTLADVLAEVRRRHAADPRFSLVIDMCSVLVSELAVGSRDQAAIDVGPDDVVDLLPPFAGGAIQLFSHLPQACPTMTSCD